MKEDSDVKKFTDTYKTLLSSSKTLEDIFEIATSLHAKEKACLYFDEDGKKQGYNYGKFKTLAYYLARHLSGALSSIAEGSLVALKLRNSPTWPLLFWAILMTGHPVLLIDARLAHDNTVNLLAQSQAKAIIVNEEELYSVASFRINDIRNAEENENFVPSWADEVIFCSSGTTGDIKMMVMKGEAFCHQIAAAANLYQETTTLMHPGKINILAMIPFHHIFGFSAVFLWFFFYGKTIVYPSSMSTRDILMAIRKAKCDHIFSVPMFWDSVAQMVLRSAAAKGEKQKRLLQNLVAYHDHEISRKEAGFAGSRLALRAVQKKIFGTQVEYCISGGGYLMPKTSAVINGIGYPLYNGFGMTEIGITSVELSPRVEDRLKCSIGHPFAGVSYKISPLEGSVNGEGELLVKSPTLHSEEIIGGVRKKSVFQNGYMRTGDIASKDASGVYFIKGRLKDTIIGSNGENVYPDEIETYFKDVKKVSNDVVVGLPQNGSEIIVLILELENSVQTEDLPKIQSDIKAINDELPTEKKVGKVLIYRKPMPMSGNLKIKRYVLLNELEKGSEDFVGFNGRRSQVSFDGYDKKEVIEISTGVRKIFSKTLLLPEFKIDDDAVWNTDLGGDSMSYVSMINDLNSAFHLTIPTEKYGKIGTVKDFTYEILVLRHGRIDKTNKKQK